MKNFKYDQNGIPILNRIGIEVLSEEIIRYLDADCLEIPKSSPLEFLMMELKKKRNVQFIFNQHLGESDKGYRFRGRFHIPSNTIYISPDLIPGEPRFNFTVAHEIGHFLLHTHITKNIVSDSDELEIKDTERDLILDHVETGDLRTWTEWQANKFASSFLMPRTTLPMAVSNIQRNMGINRNIGQIILNRQSSSFKDYKKIMEHISSTYMVSKAAIRIRLLELNILKEEIATVHDYKSGPLHVISWLEKALDVIESNFNKDD